MGELALGFGEIPVGLIARAIERIYQLVVPTNPSSNLNLGMLGGSEVVNAKAADAWVEKFLNGDWPKDTPRFYEVFNALEQQLALPDEGAFRVVLFQQVARHLRLDFLIHHPIERPDPFTVNRDILLLDLHDLYLGWAGLYDLRLRPASGDNQTRYDQGNRRRP